MGRGLVWTDIGHMRLGQKGYVVREVLMSNKYILEVHFNKKKNILEVHNE